MKRASIYLSNLMIICAGCLAIGTIAHVAEAQPSFCQAEAILKSTLKTTRHDLRVVQRKFNTAQKRVSKFETRIARVEGKIASHTNSCSIRTTKLIDRCAARQNKFEAKRALHVQQVGDLQFRLDNCVTLRDCTKIQTALNKQQGWIEKLDKKLSILSQRCTNRESQLAGTCQNRLGKREAKKERLEKRLSEWQLLLSEYELLLAEAEQLLADAEVAYNACYGQNDPEIEIE